MKPIGFKEKRKNLKTRNSKKHDWYSQSINMVDKTKVSISTQRLPVYFLMCKFDPKW